ncbi:MAG: VRR-NUC domain-containing protein [Spongiibacteraceae bacterium]
MTETRLQQELMSWLKRNYPMAAEHTFHVPNGGGRSSREGQTLKLMGVKPGVPDLLCTLATPKHRGFALELKIDSGKPSPKQIEWKQRLQAQGWMAVIATGMDQAQIAFEDYLNGK